MEGGRERESELELVRWMVEKEVEMGRRRKRTSPPKVPRSENPRSSACQRKKKEGGW